MRDPARIIDAGANRAREALRVMEDLARFVLDDQPLSAELKSIRHGLTQALAALEPLGLDRPALLAARDTPGDVGTATKTPAESRREDLSGVAAAAGSRLTEALRSIEECAKALPAEDAARAVEALRYRAYDADRRLGLALAPGARAPQWRLCVLITESLCRHHPWERVARLAVDAGADCLQLREKSMDAGELLARARRLADIARAGPRRAHVIVNDRPDVALLAGADGVHVGQSDLPADAVRRLAGPRLLVGVSTATIDQARAAARAGADYCGCGPMFHTTTTHKPVLSGPGYLRQYLADPVTTRVPHLAISGITPQNARALAELGCRGVAVSSAVCASPDPAGVCAEIVRVLAGSTDSR